MKACLRDRNDQAGSIPLPWLLAVLVLIIILAMASFAWFRWQYESFLQAPLDLRPEGQVLLVDQGMTGRSVIQRLQDTGITRWNWQWRLLMRLEMEQIQAGEYQLESGLTPIGLLEKLEQGSVIQHGFTVVEGWTFVQLLQALAKDPVLGGSAVDAEPLVELARSLTDQQNPEGWFLPETYRFTREETAAGLLQRAHQDMQEVLQDAWQGRIADHPVKSPYELLILASIIERETAIESERGEISGVFVRRLNKGMRLQTDPTVIYGLGDSFDGDIRRKDLQTDTPYNTYTRDGLPPTPIALPGKSSVWAAARPKEGTSLYFVANGQGGHTFSDTFEQHQSAVDVMLGRKP